jgi:hypothetical protein
MSDLNLVRLNAAIDQLEAARGRLKAELLRQQALMGQEGAALELGQLNAIYKNAYVSALTMLRSLPAETPGLREAIDVFLVSDLAFMQAAGMDEPEKFLLGTIHHIAHEQVRFAFLSWERAGKSMAAFYSLLIAYEEALKVGVSDQTLTMRKAKMAADDFANDLKPVISA